MNVSSSSYYSNLVASLVAASVSAFTVELTRTEGSEPVTPLHHLLHSTRLQSKSEDDRTIDLLNSSNLAYSGPVFLGTPLQGNPDSKFIYDTGSGFLTVP
jgi:hypothetical protein